MKPGRTLVVGAGIAGLSASRALKNAGVEVVVLDKARGAGGRTSTRRGDIDAFDHGAQYFTCRTDAFRRQVDDWCERGVAAPWRAEVRRLTALHKTSVRCMTRYVGVPRMSSLARDLATGQHVEYGLRATALEESAGRWRVHTESGPLLDSFDTVVVATPAPQAVPLLAPAPALAERASRVEMSACYAVLVAFERTLGVDFGGAFVEGSPLAWVARNASKPERPSGESWVLHATDAWTALHLEANPDTVAETLLRSLAERLGRELPPVRSSTAHLWRFARVVRALDGAPLWDSDARIGTCGDWTLGDRVEDAFTSGRLLAQQILEEKRLTDTAPPLRRPTRFS